jgi:hypothetical protein
VDSRQCNHVDSVAGPLLERKVGLLVPGWVHLIPDLVYLGSRKEGPKGVSKEILENRAEELAVAEDLRVPLAEHFYSSCLIHHLRLMAGCWY